MSRRTICVDFDGVLHSYIQPWIAPHVIPDPPVDGAVEWLFEIIQHFDVVIFSTRAKTWRGRRAIRRWIYKHWGVGLYRESLGNIGVENVKITAKKEPGLIYIDDRAYRFDGKNWPTKKDIYKAKPWIKTRGEDE
jgi:hypothetical protein